MKSNKVFHLKAISRLVSVCFLLLVSQASKAQFVVYDPAQFGNMIKSMVTQSQHLGAALKTLSEAKKIWDQAKQTREQIQGLHKLHRDVQDALKIARGIKDFKLANLDELASHVLELPIDPDVYMPGLPQTDRLRGILSEHPSVANTRELYELLAGLNSRSLPLNHYEEFARQNKQTQAREFALAEMTDQKKIQTALSYSQLAEEFIEQATELKEAVKLDGRLTMNESERIQALKSCQELLMQSFELKLKSDELLQSVATHDNKAKEAVQQAYGNALFRKAFAETPQMKYGE